MNQTATKTAVLISRILFGFTFAFSGFVKAVDPMGSAYKFIDYFRAFDLTFLNDLALPFAVLIAAIEFCIGIGILFGSFKRLSTIAGLLFMIFFTPLTLYLALANPVNDCGCFGDALVLTNWETFFKNIFLLGLIIFLYLNQAKITPLFSTSLRWIPVVYAFLFSCTISLIGIKDLPILDFRPYKTGVNIDKAMQAPEGAPQTEYKLVYERNGVKQEFGLDDYPTDSTWTFVETKTIQPSDKWLPAIKDFFLTDQNGDNITSDLLNYDGYTFLLISPDLNTADENYIDRINNIYDYAVNFDYRFYCATVNDESAIAEWIEHTGAEYEYIFSDVTILETIIRSNPGLVLLKDGVILWKKSPRNLPKEELLKQSLENSSLSQIKKNNPRKVILYCILIFFTPILVLLFFEKTIASYLQRNGAKKKIESSK